MWDGGRTADELAAAFAELKKWHRTSVENLDEVNMTFIGLMMLFSVLAQELETRVEEGEFPDLLNSIRERSEVLATAARNKLLARYSGGIA